MKPTEKDIKKEYDKMARKLDNRHKLHIRLKDFFDVHGKVPPEYAKEWHIAKMEDFKTWRTISGVNKRIWKTAKKMAKNAKKTDKPIDK